MSQVSRISWHNFARLCNRKLYDDDRIGNYSPKYLKYNTLFINNTVHKYTKIQPHIHEIYYNKAAHM